MIPHDELSAARTLLFAPGDRPDRFTRARDSGADVVVIDLEDAVAPQRKPAARAAARAWFEAGGRAVLRVNADATPWFDDDVAMAKEARCPVMLPKTESADQVADLVRRLSTDVPLVPLVESARGITNAVTICEAPGVARPAFGSIDLAAQLGIDPTSHAALRHARSALVMAAAAAGRAAPVDGVTPDVHDDAALGTDVFEAVRLGMTAKLLVHPRQVAIAHAGLAPTDLELAWATRILAAVDAGDGSAALVDGQMVDRPVVLRARSLVARAAEGP